MPTRIILSLLRDKEEALVFDPYMGSGTTAVASKILGFDYLGIDISESYLNYAKQRIANYKDEIEKIEKEKALHFVEKTFQQRKAVKRKAAPKRKAVKRKAAPKRKAVKRKAAPKRKGTTRGR